MTAPETTPAKAPRWRAVVPLRHREYRLLIGTVALSVFATGMWTIVMVFQVFAIDDSPVALSKVAACLSGGLFAFALFGGIAADRVSRRRVLVLVQLANTAAIGTVAVLALTGTVQLWHLMIASATLGAGSAFFYPAYTAYLPQVLPPEELLAANGLEGALRPTLQQALGPALGGVIVGAFLPGAGALVVAVAYAVALLLTCLLRPVPEPVTADDAPVTSVLQDLRDGVGYVVGTRWLLWTLIFAFLNALIIMGPIEVLLPFITRENFANGEEAFGLLLAAFGTGGAVGSLAMSSWRLPRRYLTVMVLAWGGGTIPLAVLGQTSSFVVMLLALFVVGFATGAGLVIWGTLLQRRVPAHMIGRVASLDFFVSIALMPVSIAIVGPIATVVSTPVIFAVAGVAPVLVGIIAVLAGRMPSDELAHPLDVGLEEAGSADDTEVAMVSER